jgi:hypothetical protein
MEAFEANAEKISFTNIIHLRKFITLDYYCTSLAELPLIYVSQAKVGRFNL